MQFDKRYIRDYIIICLTSGSLPHVEKQTADAGFVNITRMFVLYESQKQETAQWSLLINPVFFSSYNSQICPLGVTISCQMEELCWVKSEFPVHWISEWTIVWRNYWLEIKPVFNQGLAHGFTLLTRGISSQSTSSGPPSRGSRDRWLDVADPCINWTECFVFCRFIPGVSSGSPSPSLVACWQLQLVTWTSITESTEPSYLFSEIWTNVCLPIVPWHGPGTAVSDNRIRIWSKHKLWGLKKNSPEEQIEPEQTEAHPKSKHKTQNAGTW